jgi:hypothetical protein
MNLLLKLFTLHNTLHISDGLSVHHQEFTTVHIATGVCQTDSANCSICLTYACCCRYSCELLMMDGKTVRNMWNVMQK